MITFDLACDQGHRFEGWFRNREEFEDQLGRGLLSCPLCGSAKITKRLSAVAVHVPRRTAAPPAAPVPAPAPAPAGPAAPPPQPFFQTLAKLLEEQFEDVGAGFADEARRIDREEAVARNIRGTTTPEEEAELKEEGIEFLKVALPKYDA
ncbi:MAG: DUF1178 family protein [Deferrisomatales bacterium]